MVCRVREVLLFFRKVMLFLLLFLLFLRLFLDFVFGFKVEVVLELRVFDIKVLFVILIFEVVVCDLFLDIFC